MLRSTYRYGPLTARVRGRKSFMLVKSDYDAMLTSENVQAALRRLEKSQYQRFVAPLLIGESSMGKAEENLNKAYQAEFNFILSNLRDREAIGFFNEVNRSLELRSIAALLKSIILSVDWGRAVDYLFPCGEIDASSCRTLIESKDFKKAVQLIKEKLLARDINRIWEEAEDPARKALEVEVAIDAYASKRVWERLNGFRGRDRECTKLTGIALDTTNIMTVLRMKKLGFQQALIEKYLIPIQYRMRKDELERAVAAPTEKDSIKMLTAGFYVNIVSPLISTYAVKEDLSLFEIAFKRFHSNLCEKIFIHPFFHLGVALAYLYLKWYEVRDLIAILTGKHLGLASERIALYLTLHQPPHPI